MAWFESVAEAQRRARRVLPSSVYKAILAGAERGQTLRDNLDAFAELGFAPHVAGASAVRVAGDVGHGRRIDLPVLLSPTGVQAVHPEGELAVARAAARAVRRWGSAGSPRRRSRRWSPLYQKTFAQLYWAGSREAIEARVERARAAGAAGLIITLDWTFSHARDWGSPTIPSAGSQDDGALRARGAGAADLARPLGALGCLPALGCPTSRARRLLRRLRRVDGHPAAVLGGPHVAARAVGRAVHGQGRHARRRRTPRGGRRRRDRDLRLQPRRQQPRRDARVDPSAGRGRRGGRRPRPKSCSTAACAAAPTS